MAVSIDVSYSRVSGISPLYHFVHTSCFRTTPLVVRLVVIMEVAVGVIKMVVMVVVVLVVFMVVC